MFLFFTDANLLLQICAKMVSSLTERVFIFQYYFASKSFAAIREAFSSAYPDKDIQN